MNQVDNALVQFWNELKKIPVPDNLPENYNKFLRLPENIYLFGNSKNKSGILLRKAYFDLFEMFIHPKDPEQSKLVITGNPGIGKTLFCVFVMWHAARENRTVVWDAPLDNMQYLFTSTEVRYAPRSNLSFYKYMKNPEVWYIVDAHEPFSYPARTLLVTPPQRNIYKHILKLPDAMKVYMPTWTFEELEICRQELFPEVSMEQMERLFRIWGGIPRTVLQRANRDPSVLKDEMESALSVCNLEVCVHAVGEMNSDKDVSHRCLHVVVENDNYSRVKLRFGSPYIEHRLIQSFIQYQRQQLVEFLAAADGQADYAALRGYIFEGFAHSVLSRGGTFTVRPLQTDSSEQDLKVQPTDWKTFSRLNDVDMTSSLAYWQPIQSNLASVDAMTKATKFESSEEWQPALFQMTISVTHPIKVTGLQLILERAKGLPLGTRRLFFVVPPNTFDRIGRQDYHNEKGTVYAKTLPSEFDLVEQWALKINLSCD